MFKKIAAFLIVLVGIGGAAFAAQHPAPAAASSMIASTGQGGNYYYLFVPDHSVSARVRVIRAWNSAVGGVTAKDVASISVSGGVYGIAVDSKVGKLYVSIAGGSPSVNVYDISYTSPDAPTFTLKSTITGFTYPMGIALSRDNKYLYVADSGAGKVQLIDTATNTIVGSIGVGGTNLTGVAVNPDNNHLAVSRNVSSGTVYIYDISAVPTTIPTTPLYTVTSGMDEPTYLAYSNDGLMLYVKVNQKASPFNDVIGLYTTAFGNPFLWPYSEVFSVSLVQANEEHPNNKWDGLAISPTDDFLYLTHYRTSIDIAKTNDDGIYGYVIKAKNNFQTNNVYVDANKDGKDDNDLGWQLFGSIVYNEGLDSVVSAPNGGRVWAADSVHGFAMSVDSGTGYYNPNLNTPPSAVSNMRIENTVLKWDAAIDDGKYTTSIGKKMAYVIEYKTAVGTVWQTDLGNVESNDSTVEKDIASLSYGTTYYFRVKAYDGGDAGTWTAGWFGPYAVIGPVAVGTMAGGNISYVSMKVNNVETTVEAAGAKDYITIHGKGFGAPDSSKVGTAQYNVKIGGKIVQSALAAIDPKTPGVKVWNDTQIDVLIPRIMQDASYLESGVATIEVTANSLLGGSKHFSIYPQLWSVSPAKGAAGSAVELSGLSFGQTGTATITKPANGYVAFVNLPTMEFGTVISWTREAELNGSQNDKIKCNVPATLADGKYQVMVYIDGNPSPAKTFEVSGGSIVPTTSAVIDDFEGTNSYYDDSTQALLNPKYPDITKTGSYNNSATNHMGEITYSYSGAGYGDMWGATFYGSKAIDIAKSSDGKITFDRLSYHVKPDGSGNEYRIEVQSTEKDSTTGKNILYRAPDQKLTGTSWATVEVKYSDMWWDKNSNGSKDAGETTFDSAAIKTIEAYNIVYTGKSTSATAHDFDDIEAVGVPVVIGDITTSIKRDADTVGSSVTLSWIINKAGVTAVDIYSVSGTSESTTAVYTTDYTKWAVEKSNESALSYTDISKEGKVGAGYQKYYKVVPYGTDKTKIDFTKDVVGKFDLGVAPSTKNAEKAFISLPLEQPTSFKLEDVIGKQPSEKDIIAEFDFDGNLVQGSYYSSSTGKWAAAESKKNAITHMNLGYAYAYITTQEAYLTVVGKAKESKNTRTLQGKQTTTPMWIANAFPAPAAIDKAGLNSSTTGSTNTTAAWVANFDANGLPIGGLTDGYALHTATGWIDGKNNTATLQLIPGRGYLFVEPTQSTLTWDQPRP